MAVLGQAGLLLTSYIDECSKLCWGLPTVQIHLAVTYLHRVPTADHWIIPRFFCTIHALVTSFPCNNLYTPQSHPSPVLHPAQSASSCCSSLTEQGRPGGRQRQRIRPTPLLYRLYHRCANQLLREACRCTRTCTFEHRGQSSQIPTTTYYIPCSSTYLLARPYFTVQLESAKC